MTDHIRTEKIGGDSVIIFVVFQVVAGNCYDSLATPLGTSELGQFLSHVLSFHCVSHAKFICCVCCAVIMHLFVLYFWFPCYN